MVQALQSRSVGRAALSAALAPLFCIPAPAAGAQATAVDLELVLAVDVSQSVNSAEFALQMAGYAKAFRMSLFEANRFEGRRKIIDLSGDGIENRGAEPGPVRDLAVALGLTNNGLAISTIGPISTSTTSAT